jgi:hypothetical protein
MASSIQLFFILIMFAASTLGGGYFFVRRLAVSPLSTLCLAIAVGITNVYLIAMLTYVMAWPLFVFHGAMALFVILGVACREDFRRLMEDQTVRVVLQGFGMLLFMVLALTLTIESYSGGGSYGDYFEHYHRSIFFLERLPLDSQFLGIYSLPARPPLFNLVAEFYMAMAGRDYFHFQWIATILNLVVFFPCCLAAQKLGISARRMRFLPLLFLVNPFFLQNATYPWSKLITVFFIVLAILYYFSYARNRDGQSLFLAVALMTIGFLTHYSAGPFALFMVVHYLFITLPKIRTRLPEMLLATVIGLGLLSTWFGWSFLHYGVQETLASNTAVSDAVQLSGLENAQKILANIRDTLVPHPLRGASLLIIAQESFWGSIRDYVFLIYQTNLIFALGSVSGVVLLASLPHYIKDFRLNPGVRFWALFSVFCIILGIAVHGTPSDFGLAHIVLQPIVMLGLVLILHGWERWPTWVRIALLCGIVIDIGLGIVLHFGIQGMTPVPIDQLDWPLSRTAFFNWQLKESYYLRFLADAIPVGVWIATALIGALFAFSLKYHSSRSPSRP